MLSSSNIYIFLEKFRLSNNSNDLYQRDMFFEHPPEKRIEYWKSMPEKQFVDERSDVFSLG